MPHQHIEDVPADEADADDRTDQPIDAESREDLAVEEPPEEPTDVPASEIPDPDS